MVLRKIENNFDLILFFSWVLLLFLLSFVQLTKAANVNETWPLRLERLPTDTITNITTNISNVFNITNFYINNSNNTNSTISWRDDPNSFFNKYKVLIFLAILIVIVIVLIIVFSEKVEHIGFGGDFAPRLGGSWD